MLHENEKKVVYIAHAIDAEGPLYESIQATFDRLKVQLGIELEATSENLRLLRSCKIPLNGKEEIVKRYLDEKLYNYNDSWDKIESMYSDIMDESFRNELLDSNGKGWAYSFFCLDFVNFDDNPRYRAMGYHSIHDRYIDILKSYGKKEDELQWHYHPMTIYKEANRNATNYLRGSNFFEILTRRIIDRNFFPTTFRAGFVAERPDSHWLLEQWIPFDGSNRAVENSDEENDYAHLKGGRLADWRRAPSDWSIYHPDHDDYQSIGKCRRLIGRFLNLGGRVASITHDEVHKAFERANNKKPTLLGITNHDYRQMSDEIRDFREMLKKASNAYPDVKFVFTGCSEAFKKVACKDNLKPIKLRSKIVEEDGKKILNIDTLEGKVFGPQPFLAIKTKSGKYIHDNLDFGLDRKSWSYTFDQDTVPMNDVSVVAIAANDQNGYQHLEIVKR